MKPGFFSTVMTTVLILSGCAASPPRLDLNNQQAVASAISVQHDDFKKVTQFKGPNAYPDSTGQLFIRAWKPDDTDTTIYQIYVMDFYYGDWRFYSSAYDSNGSLLDLKEISREIRSCRGGRCSFEEHVGLNVTREYLDKNQESGIRFKISGKGGEAVLYIPPGYVTGFLSAVK